MKRITLAIIFLIPIFFIGCSHNKSQQNTNQTKKQTVQEEKKGPQTIKLHAVNAQEVVLTKDNDNIKIKGIEGKVILLDFFATWCPPCKAEIPHLVNLQKKYKDKLVIISILLEGDKPDNEIKSFIKYHGINYIVTNDKNNFKLSNMLGGVKNIPYMILYDKNGNLITHYLGAIPEEMINSDIQKAVK